MTAPPGVRLAEIVGTLALAQDGAFGQPADALLRAAMIATVLAERVGLDSVQREAVRWAAPLRYLGCISHAHDVAVMFGDEIEFRAHSSLADPSNPIEVLRDIVTRGGGGRSPVDRVRTVLAMLAGGARTRRAELRHGMRGRRQARCQAGNSGRRSGSGAVRFRALERARVPGRRQGRGDPVADARRPCRLRRGGALPGPWTRARS